ncbi:siderophore-interacting protein [Neorhizobium lilium]|uniref:Siderophore-interacting protein n=1 Tax=Neorhizobium lilium TaxID=2503024 RepID=A0A444LHQ1_9HYPH|nr:siderophore-interacting protein [Neorhizobium lilium]RWX78566.1 siderophore-interacting protein [Neorhizobium lilium]
MNEAATQRQPVPQAGARIERIRHDLKRRELTVTDVVQVTPNMRRLTLAGNDLGDFVSASPDDHIKIFLPASDGELAARDYTPRRYDTKARQFVLDFALHDAGPATVWASQAKSGDTLLIGGPRGSAVITGVRRWLLVGDETALPAIGRRIEEAHQDEDVTVVAVVTGAAEEQSFDGMCRLRTTWVHRPLARAADASPVLAALAAVNIEGETFAWIAAEASVARAVRAYLTEKRNHPLTWLKASGYWLQGQADAHEKIE